VNPFLIGLVAGAAGVLWKRIPYTHPATDGWKATRYCTILTEGVNFRGRVRGRLYSLDIWREHGKRR
jgi:hypothetical protein